VSTQVLKSKPGYAASFPDGESPASTYDRTMSFSKDQFESKLKEDRNILIMARYNRYGQ